MIQFGFDVLYKCIIDDNFILNFILNKNIKEKDYQNSDFNKYLKSLKYKISDKPLIIHIIEVFLSEKEKNSNYEKYLDTFIEEIKKNDSWKKLEKDNEEIKLIRNIKIPDYSSLISFFEKKKTEIKEITPKTESKKNLTNFDITENECPLKKNCFFNKNKINAQKQDKISNIKNKNKYDKKKYGTFDEIDLENIIICIKRDILLKECSAFFYEIYFKDKNFNNLKKLFKYKYEHHPIIKLLDINNRFDKLNCPVYLKNYSNNKYAYPQLYLKPYTSFYNNKTLNISHPYYNKNIIKKPSFPYILPHYFLLNSILDKEKPKKELFNEECELIMKTSIICGNLIIKEKMIYFINNNDMIKEYGKNIKYLFSSLADDIRNKEKIIIIKIKDIEEIIARRFLYDYRACEFFLKSGKSYYFNLYSKENIFGKLFKELEKFEELKDKIISNPIKYFKEKKYEEKWIQDEITTYQYLLYINKFSSRSYNDINQYPIFPWIFRETSLGSYNDKGKLPKFRDLQYPISIRGKSLGDSSKEKEDLEEAKSFFDSSLEESTKYPSHFRLHYSTSGYLLSFLVRISPYTEEQIRFQNNQFDSPNRQLNSIDEILTILSSSHDNRELIPEFFTSVEYYLNMNYVFFGCRTSDKVLINDIGFQGEFFNSIAQYVYFNRLVLNIKFDMNDLIKNWYKEAELKINSWIDLIFGNRQWSPKPKKENLNLFGKYCYSQYIKFDKILEKYRRKNYDEKTIIKKIETKKSRIINFGQCPEVLFNKPQKSNVLPQTEIGDEKTDDFEQLSEGAIHNTFSFEEFAKNENKNYQIVNFWVTEQEKNNSINDYLYFLVFEEKKDENNNNNNNNPNNLSILIYKDGNSKMIKPEYVINIQEINLFSNKAKYEKKKRKIKKSQTLNENSDIKDKLKEKETPEEKNEENKKKEFKEFISYYNYKLSPKNCIFELCCSKRIYFFVGRNIDNSLKIYEIEIDKTKEGKLLYTIPMDNFVSCVYKINDTNFFTGHKNGKIYEWKIAYNSEKKKEKIINIEIIRDLIAHKDSMICNIYYIDKHNVLITSSNDGKLFIRKYYDFELLSIIETNENINKLVYSDYDLLYILTTSKDNKRKLHNKSRIHIYTLNGLLLESSIEDYFIDIEAMKNGILFFNTINSNKLGIFGFKEKKGTVEEYDILSYIFNEKDKKKEKEKEKIIDPNATITNFSLKIKLNVVYILIDNKLIRQKIFDFNSLYKGVYKQH